MEQPTLIEAPSAPEPATELLGRLTALEAALEDLFDREGQRERVTRPIVAPQALDPLLRMQEARRERVEGHREAALGTPALPFRVETVKPEDYAAEQDLWERIGKLQVEGNVTRDEKSQRGKFAGLSQVLEIVKPRFKEAGLGFFHVTTVATGRIVVHTVPSKFDRHDKLVETHHDARSFMQDVDVTLVAYTAKARLITTMRGTAIFRPANSMEQAVGIVTSYFRRYGLKSLMGIAEVDTDGEHGEALQPLRTDAMGPAKPPEGEA